MTRKQLKELLQQRGQLALALQNPIIASLYFETGTSQIKRLCKGSTFRSEKIPTLRQIKQLKEQQAQSICQHFQVERITDIPKEQQEEYCMQHGFTHLPLYSVIDPFQLLEQLDTMAPTKRQKPLFMAIEQYQKDHNKKAFLRKTKTDYPYLMDYLHFYQIGVPIKTIAAICKCSTPEINKYNQIRDRLLEQKLLHHTPSYEYLSHPSIQEFAKTPELAASKVALALGCSQEQIFDVRADRDLFHLSTLRGCSQSDTLSKQHTINQRREQVWALYSTYGSTDGYTQQEIADLLHVTVETVRNDLAVYKRTHPEVLDPTQLYQARHSGIDRYQIKEKRMKQASAIYQSLQTNYPDLSHAAYLRIIGEQLKISTITINQLLIETGDYLPSQTKIMPERSHYAQKGYENIGQFSGGATVELLAEHPEDTFEDRHARRARILAQQRATQAILRSHPELTQSFVERQGDYKTAFSEWKSGQNESQGDIEHEP